MKISIVIPTYNRKDVLINKTLPALERQDFPKEEYEILVVNDGSTDGTLEALENYSNAVNLNIRLFTQPNLGPAAARNQAIRQATGEVLIIIGDDTYPSDNKFISAHYDHHNINRQDNEAMLGLTTWDESIETPFMHWVQVTGKQFEYKSIRSNTYVDYWFFYTSNISLKKKFITLNSEFLDERFKQAAYEDFEWGYRLEKNCNMKLFYNDRARLYHYHKYTPSDFVKRAYACEQMLGLVREINSELYLRIIHKSIFRTIGKKILLNNFFAKKIPLEINFEAYPRILQELIYKLWTVKYKMNMESSKKSN
jgi:glycosyltransferase involved in cell wall biosynthesis